MNARLDMIGIVTRDMAESLRFYRLVGLEPPEWDGESPYVEVNLQGGIRISWNTEELVKSLHADWSEPVGQRLGLAFLCESPEGVNEKFAELTGASFKGVKEPWDAFWGQRYAMVEDPDGNVIDLFAPLPTG